MDYLAHKKDGREQSLWGKGVRRHSDACGVDEGMRIRLDKNRAASYGSPAFISNCKRFLLAKFLK